MNHTYSYTQLSQFRQCPYAYFLERIYRDENGDKLEQQGNPFSENGSLVHDLLDKWAKHEIAADKLAEEYVRRYPDEVVSPFPAFMKGQYEKLMAKGEYYFQMFDEFAGKEIVSTEHKFKTDLCGRKFTGIIDMVVTENDQLIVLDHKSKSLSSFRKSEQDMYRQLYLYSDYVKKWLGRYPDTLMFNLFNECGTLKSKQFSQAEFDECVRWADETMTMIENATELDYMDTNPDQFFCQNLCSVREYCEEGKK